MPENSSVLPGLPEENHKQSFSIGIKSILEEEDLSSEETFILFELLQEVPNELRSIKRDKKHPTTRRSDAAYL